MVKHKPYILVQRDPTINGNFILKFLIGLNPNETVTLSNLNGEYPNQPPPEGQKLETRYFHIIIDENGTDPNNEPLHLSTNSFSLEPTEKFYEVIVHEPIAPDPSGGGSGSYNNPP